MRKKYASEIRNRGASAGFSLVEIMVAMVIALIALGAVIALYLSSVQTAQYQQAMQRVQENGRFAVDLISRSVRMAGYDNPLDDAEDTNSPKEITGVWLKGTANQNSTLFSQTGLKTGADTLGMVYQGGAGITDCQGRTTTSSELVSNMYAVSSDNNLVCATQDDAGNTVNVTEISEGVQDLRIIYGEDPDGDRVANRYVNPGDISDWEDVVSIRVMLLLSSGTNVLKANNSVCLGCVFFSGSRAPAADRQIWAEFQTTVGIRNYVPD